MIWKEHSLTLAKHLVFQYNLNLSPKFYILASLEENEKGIGLQDIHEAFQLLLKIVKARNIFAEKLERVKNKEIAKEITEDDVQIKVHKTASLFRKK